jgi:DNA-binding SARP family transcriptional activator
VRSASASRSQAQAAAGADPAESLILEQDRLQLNRAVLDLDLALLNAVERSAQAAPAEQTDLRATLLAALNAYRGDFLLGFSISGAPAFDEWVSIERQRCHRQMHSLFEQLMQFLCADGKWKAAIDVARRWVAHDPLHEAPYQRLMQAHTAAGNLTAALHAYQHYCWDTVDERNDVETQVNEAIAVGIALSQLPAHERMSLTMQTYEDRYRLINTCQRGRQGRR